MGIISWLSANWFELLQSLAITSGFFLNAHSKQRDAVARKISNFLAITERHQALWNEMHERPELSRILEENPALDKTPVTRAEERFVTKVAIHVDSVYRAMKVRMIMTMEGLGKDIREFFSLPIPNKVWEKAKHLHDSDFVEFVDSSIK